MANHANTEDVDVGPPSEKGYLSLLCNYPRSLLGFLHQKGSAKLSSLKSALLAWTLSWTAS